MKLAVCSDLHLEFGDLNLVNTENANVLVLSGDIMVVADLADCTFGRGKIYFDFIMRCMEQFPLVVMVMGNHEHYHGDYSKSADLIRKTFADWPRFILLDKESLDIDGHVIFGGTLWTDMNKEDHLTMHQVKSMMNDYRIIANTADGKSVFQPEDSVEDHYEFRRRLDAVIEANPGKSIVVVGHHAPSKASTHPRYQDEYIINGAYSSDLSEYILDRPMIKVWTHGHTHHVFDYMIGECRVVCNPRGYIGHEQRANEFTLKYLEV